jgi:hypothetical protein
MSHRDRYVLVCGLIAQERVSINKAVDDLSPIEKEQLFTVLEEKLDYPANLEESIRKKAIKDEDMTPIYMIMICAWNGVEEV